VHGGSALRAGQGAARAAHLQPPALAHAQRPSTSHGAPYVRQQRAPTGAAGTGGSVRPASSGTATWASAAAAAAAAGAAAALAPGQRPGRKSAADVFFGHVSGSPLSGAGLRACRW
jgi:hypothetical protein